MKVFGAIQDGYQDYIDWMNWSEIMPSAEQVEEECRKHHAQFILREEIRFLIIHKETKEVLGRSGFPSILWNWTVPCFSISYFLRQSARGQGFALEAVNALAHYAFDQMGAKKVEINVDPMNTKSLKIPEKLGFLLEAKQKGRWPSQNKKDLAELWTYALFDTKTLPELNIIYHKERQVY